MRTAPQICGRINSPVSELRMSDSPNALSPAAACAPTLEFLAAVFYFFLARSLARHSAYRPSPAKLVTSCSNKPSWSSCFYSATRLWASGSSAKCAPSANRDFHAAPGLSREFGLGPATGWALPWSALSPWHWPRASPFQSLYGLKSWGWVVLDAAFFLLAALAEEVAFRATVFSVLSMLLAPLGRLLVLLSFMPSCRRSCPARRTCSFAVSFVLSLVLSTAYLRTRGLWVSWGINFAWKASRARSLASPSAVSTAIRPLFRATPWAHSGLPAEALASTAPGSLSLAMLLALPVVYSITSDLDFRYNAPVIVPGWHPRRPRCCRPRSARRRHGACRSGSACRIGTNSAARRHAERHAGSIPTHNSEFPAIPAPAAQLSLSRLFPMLSDGHEISFPRPLYSALFLRNPCHVHGGSHDPRHCQN